MAVNNITWLDDEAVTDIKLTPQPFARTATGYGAKLPTRYMLRIGTRWHRLYAMCYGNTSTHYIVKAGEDLILTTATEHRIERRIEQGRTSDPSERIAS